MIEAAKIVIFAYPFYNSTSQDQTAVIWDWDITKNSVERMHICKGHEKSVEAVSINQDATLMATGGWDATLKIWLTCKYFFMHILIQ